MKKILLGQIILGTFLYGSEVSLDELLKSVEKNSYENKLYNVKKEENKEQEKILKKGKYNGINIQGESEYKKNQEKYILKNKATFGDFYIEGEKEKQLNSKGALGIEISLKDKIFSKEDSQLKNLINKKHIDKIDYVENLKNEKIKLIELYKNYKDNEFELKLKENALKTLEKEKNILEKSYSLGNISKIDLNSLMVTYNNLQLEIKNIKSILEQIKKIFFYEFQIEIGEQKLKEIHLENKNLEKYIKNIGKNSIEKLELEKTISEENLKYIKYDNKVPEFYIGGERNLESSDNRVFLRFSKDIFYEDTRYIEEKSSLEKININLEREKNKILSEHYKIEDGYFTLEKEFLILKNRSTLEKDKYEIKKIENKLGKISYTEVMETFDNYLELEVLKEKAKNSLNSYMYIIKIKGE
ncbi:TolC family protein [Cetobacterium ceti]